MPWAAVKGRILFHKVSFKLGPADLSDVRLILRLFCPGKAFFTYQCTPLIVENNVGRAKISLNQTIDERSTGPKNRLGKSMTKTVQDSPLIIAGKEYSSRLLVGSGKYKDNEETRLATEASGAEIITVAVRRSNIGQKPGEPNLLDVIPPEKYTILPNTAGCYSVDDAVRTCRLARELLDGHKLVKLEVLADEKTLFPDVMKTLKAAEILIKEDFDVMVYTTDDLVIAKELEAMGCAAVMPLASPIGSGLGIQNPNNIRFIIEELKVPVLIDAGVGTASDAAVAMELGCDGVLMNSAIAAAKNPVLMASAMKKAIQAGREAFLAGRMPRKRYASASSPLDGTFF